MGAARKIDIHGAKGGEEKPKTPTEAPDSLRSVAIAKMLIAVGEGEFEGTPTAADIYLDNTPLQDPQGNMNFPNVKWEWRTGAVDQTYIQGIPSVENETTISTELRSGTPWVRAISNIQLSAVRVRFAWPALQSVDAEGNINGYRIEYKVELATDGGAYQQVLSEAVDGKTTTVYERTRRIDLPKAATGWLMKITRLTINQNNNKISDTMQIAGFTEVIDAKIRYPNTALLYIEFSAEQFRSIPAVTVETKLKKMQVPSNYDPVSRSYTGVWDGTFKQAWADNPTWMTYDITTADRFGLGRRIKPWMVDKWELYRISQYCDQLVPDGKGGQEPRFICNLNLQGKADAWTLLRDISAIYRGMTYWAQGQVFTLSDMPRATDFDFAYTRANVIDGKFTYSSASERTRYTRALISYDNPANNYDTDVTAVTDQKLQRRYGDNPLEISAIGCTRESEAQRRGKWALLTNSKDRGVTFKVGLDGRIPLPGYVIPVADELLAGRPVGGRISAVNGKAITLDRDTQAKPGDRLILNLPDGKCEGRTVQLVSGRKVTVTTAYSVSPERELVWALDADDLAIPLYRVTSVSRPEPGVFEISAVQYDPSKFAHIDTGARLEERPISVIPITVVAPPASVTLSSSYMVDQGITVATMNISWPAVNGAVAYDVEWRKDSGNWIKVQRTGSTSVDVTGIYSGAYMARVRSVSAFEISSIWKSSNLTNLEGKVGLPPAVAFLTTTSELFGISIKWGFPPGAEDTQRTEVWYGAANSLPAATKLADLAYPQADYRMQQLKAGATLFFWARLVDRTGNLGPFYPVVDGVMGQASSDATAILEQIAGEITESELGKELTARIDLIDMNGPGSVNDRLGEVKSDLEEQVIGVATSVASVRNDLTAQTATVSQVKSDLATQVVTLNGAITTTKNSLQTQIDAVNTTANALNYVSSKTYSVGETVRVGQRLYQADKAVPINMTPPNASYWLDVGTIVVSANGLSARVSTTETKITSIEGVNTAQGTSITGLQTALTGKADASAVTSLTTRVTATESKNTSQDSTLTSQGSAITGLTNTVAGKADSTTVASLTNTVTLQGAAITAQGQSSTTINANLGEVGSQNLLYNPSFDAPVTDFRAAGWYVGGSAGAVAMSLVNSTLDPAGKAQRLDVAGLSSTVYSEVSTELARRPAASEGQVFTSSVYVRGTVGLNAQLYIQALNASNTPIATTTGAFFALTGDWQRVALTSQAFPAGTVKAHIIYRARNGSSVTAGFLEFDRAQAQVGSTMSGWQDSNGTLATDVAANASATTALTGRVTTAENTIVSQGSAITSLNNVVANKADGSAVTALTTRVTATESKNASQDAAIDSQSQSITNLTNTVAGKADSTAVTALTSRVTAAEGVNTTQGASITSLNNTVADKADSAVVSSLTSRVSSAENSITSQGQSITGLTNSLTTTNSNVTAAQAAATNAATLAGSKGKTMVQSATPAAADQLSQNLWIDTTNNANTPKRWTGSAWAAVTDKAATDAAAAAASALAQVATKAEASTVQALSNTVTQQGADLTAAGNAITNIDAKISSVGGQNLLFNPSFERGAALADGWSVSGSATVSWSLVASTLDPSGKAQRLDLTIPGASFYMDLTPNLALEPAVSVGQIVTMSAYFRATSGMIAQLFFQWRNAAGTVISTDGATSLTADGSWQRVSRTSVPAPEGAVSVRTLFRIRGPLSGASITGYCEWDRAQFEVGSTVSGWRDNGALTDAAIAAQATATNALTGRVTQTETSLTSISGQITSLNNSVGQMGGDNLLPNSSFEQVSSTGWPTYWRAAGSAAPVVTYVDSTLSSSLKAVRLTRNALPSGSYIDLQLYQAEGADPKVTEGQSYTLSVYVRMSSPSARFSMYIQWLNAAGTNLVTTPLTEVQVGTVFTRMSLTAVAPTGAVAAHVYAGRLLNRAAAAADMWIELDNVQFQEGTVLTAYSPSVQGVASEQAATSAAVTALQSAVTQSGADIASVSSRTTSLENAVNSTTNGLPTKASASAVDTLTNRVTSIEGVNTSQSSSITDLNNSVSTIQGSLGASGLDPAPDATWNFDTSADGWSITGGTISAANGVLTVTATTNDPQLTRGSLSISGALYPLIRAKITRRAGSDWDGQLFYVTASHGFSSGYRKTAPNPNIAIGQSAVVEWDMSNLTAGGTDWLNSTITSLRLDLGANTGGSFNIDWIVVGRSAPGASSRALSSLSSTVTQQGTKLTAESTRIDGLYTSVGSANSAIQTEATTRADADSAQATQITSLQSSLTNTNAAIQSEATTRANADSAMAKRIDGVQSTAGTASANAQTALNTAADVSGKASAMWSVKLQVDSAGRYYAAGIGLGLENTGAGLQSSFIVSADRFAIINGLGGSPVSPFAVVGGQTFISSAFIQDASITSAKIGDYISSSNFVPNTTGWVLYKNGVFEINSAIPGGGKVQLTSNGLFVYDNNGVLRVQVGNLG